MRQRMRVLDEWPRSEAISLTRYETLVLDAVLVRTAVAR
jgi:hypothetical protein